MIPVKYFSVMSNRGVDFDKIHNEIAALSSAKKIALFYSNQYERLAQRIDDSRIVLKRQTLGCMKPILPTGVDCLILVGQGMFHAVSLAWETGIQTYILEGERLRKVEGSEIEKLKRKQQGAYLKYLNSEEVGVIVSTKPGQARIKKAEEFALATNKRAYIFVANDINLKEFENFGVDTFVNTACPRLDMEEEYNVLNLEKLYKLEEDSSKN